MVLHHNGIEYDFQYDFAPNDGTDKVPTITVVDGQTLDGEIFITEIYVGDKLRPVTTEVLGLMKVAAGREELEEGRRAWRRLLNRSNGTSPRTDFVSTSSGLKFRSDSLASFLPAIADLSASLSS